MASQKKNIVLFPFMAQGHILPFLALAQQILKRNNDYTITFINTPFNIKRIKPSISQDSSIHLVEIPFNSSDHGLPPNSENTDSVPVNLIVPLLQTCPSFKPYFKKLIDDLVRVDGEPPLCIIVDMFFPWCAEIAHEFGVFHAIFDAGGAYGMAVYHTLWSNLPHLKLSSSRDGEELIALPGFPNDSKIHLGHINEHLMNAKSDDSWTMFQQKVFDEWLDSDALLLNTVEEFDQVGLTYFREKLNFPVWAVGPVNLLSNRKGGESLGGKESGMKWDVIKEWLDSKPLNSVLYISFGSQATISLRQMMELAIALESSGEKFIWVIRPPSEFDLNSQFDATRWLPNGFVDRMQNQDQGLLVQSWAPQLKVLSHESISVFLTHCGWNSVLESLSNGVPLMAWPMIAEQHFNAKMLVEEMGVCVEVAPGITSDSDIRHEDILEKIQLVMNDTEKGKDMKRRASEIRDLIKKAMNDENDLKKGSSVKAMDEFLHAAESMYDKRKLKQSNGSAILKNGFPNMVINSLVQKSNGKH